MMILKSKNSEITQAVLICDNFHDEFQPIESEQQLPLLKIVNCPLIEYTLTFLKSSGIEQVIVFSSNSTKLKDYLEQKKWIKENEEIPFVVVIASDNLTSLGDVMRDVFNNNLVKNDFVLLNGNIIGSNIPLLNYLKKHIDRRKNEDKWSIMTMIYSKFDLNHRSRFEENESILVLNKDTRKILFYETLITGNSKKKIGLKLDFFQNNTNLNIRFDLQDTNIAICSISVPQLFADNFDYNTKDDFIHSILAQEEILQNTIYSEIIDEGSYAIKVNNAHSFDAVSRDIIQRWSFPLVPDLQDDLCYHRHNIYKSSTVDLKIDSVLEQNLVIGKNTSIESNSRIRESVIGENCKIGKNVCLDGCYLMDNVIIENDCKLSKCILSNMVLVKKNCQIKEGCIIGENCILGPDICLEKCTLIQEKSEFGEKLDIKLVGKEGKGYMYRIEDKDESDLNDVREKETIKWGMRSFEKVENISSDESEELSGDEQNDEQIEDIESDNDFKRFYNEVIETLDRGLEEKIEANNLILEVNCLKHAYNVPIKEMVCLIIKSILDLSKKYIDKTINDATLYYAKFNSILKYFLPLFKNYVKTEESQKDCLLTLENYFLINGALFTVDTLVKVLYFLYNNEALNEDLILEWNSNLHSFPAIIDEFLNDEKREKLRSNEKLKNFIKWLAEAEEESSDEESD